MDFRNILQSLNNISEGDVSHKAGPGGYGNRHGSETVTDQYGKKVGKVSLASLAPKDDTPKKQGRPKNPDKPKTGENDPKNTKVADLFGRTTGDVPTGKKGTEHGLSANEKEKKKAEKKAEKKSLKEFIEDVETNQQLDESEVAEAKPSFSRNALDLKPVEGGGAGLGVTTVPIIPNNMPGGANMPAGGGPKWVPTKIPFLKAHQNVPPTVTPSGSTPKLPANYEQPAITRLGKEVPTATSAKPKITVKPGETSAQAVQRARTEKEFGDFLKGQSGKTFSTPGSGRGTQGGPTAAELRSAPTKSTKTIEVPADLISPNYKGSFIKAAPVKPTTNKNDLGSMGKERPGGNIDPDDSFGSFRPGIDEAVTPPKHYGGQGPLGAAFDLEMYKRKEALEKMRPIPIKPLGEEDEISMSNPGKLSNQEYKDSMNQRYGKPDLDTSRMNKSHQDFYDKNPSFKQSGKEIVTPGDGRLASKVVPAVTDTKVGRIPMNTPGGSGVRGAGGMGGGIGLGGRRPGDDSRFNPLKLEAKDLPGDQDDLDVAPPKGKLTSADFKALSKKKKVKESKIMSIVESINFKELMANADADVQEMLMELQNDVEMFKETGQSSELLDSFLKVHLHKKKKITDEAMFDEDASAGAGRGFVNPPLVNPNKPVPPARTASPGFGKDWKPLTPDTSTSSAMGTIKGGVWTADPPKPGERGVPAPSGDPEGVREAGSFIRDLASSRKKFEGKEMKDTQFESWEKELNSLLNEGITVSTSTGQQGAPDSVSINATDNDANELLNILRQSGMGVFGGNEKPTMTPYGVISQGEEEPTGTGTAPEMSPEVVGDGDDMLSLLKKMSGLSAGPVGQESEGTASSDYADEEGAEEVDEQYLSEPIVAKPSPDNTNPPSTPAPPPATPGSDGTNEGEVEEGAGVMHFKAQQAKADGKDSFKLGGKEYPVKEGMAEDSGDPQIRSGMKTKYGTVVSVDGNIVTVKASNGDMTTVNIDDIDQAMSEGHDHESCNECGQMMYEGHTCEEQVEEGFSNDAGGDAMANTELAKLKTLLSMGGDLNKMKRDQTVLNPTQVSMAESLAQWKRLSGIK